MILSMLLQVGMLQIKHLVIKLKKVKMLTKLLFGIVLISAANCNCTRSDKKINDMGIKSVCESFVRAICTKDTSNFYKVIDKETLTKNINNWIKEGKKPNQDDLYVPFFLAYSPLKIRYQDLMDNRKKENFFKDFSVNKVKMLTKTIVNVDVKWTENILNADSKEIELTLQRDNEWKITDVKWKPL